MLDEQGGRLLGLLVSILPRARPDNPGTFITYKQVHERLGLQLFGATYGESLKVQGLTSLADWTAEERHPAITGLIVAEGSFLPGDGYFKLFGKEGDYQWWEQEIRRSKDYDWSPYLPLELEDLARIDVSDNDEPPGRVETIVNRIVRDTKIAQAVKRLHNHECQICEYTIALPDGRRYAEAHHVRPLGRKHKGPDKASNILCLCPNCHAQLDLGAIRIEVATLRTAKGHALDEVFANYHNKEIYLGRP